MMSYETQICNSKDFTDRLKGHQGVLVWPDERPIEPTLAEELEILASDAGYTLTETDSGRVDFAR